MLQQISSSPQTLPQVPQLLSSFSRSTHSAGEPGLQQQLSPNERQLVPQSPQASSLQRLIQEPPQQASVALQTFPHDPQFEESSIVSLQEPSQQALVLH